MHGKQLRIVCNILLESLEILDRLVSRVIAVSQALLVSVEFRERSALLVILASLVSVVVLVLWGRWVSVD